ncbi:MAG: hypothetical protein PHF57_13650 [Methanoregula sp.]|nr:hypothetical protein [Methanoregula sp.]
MHQRDLPVLGVAHDIKEGLGLWNYPKSAFVLEYALYVGVTLLVMPMPVAVPLIIIGSIFHLVNANSFSDSRNPTRSRLPTRTQFSPFLDSSFSYSRYWRYWAD